jgi:hypothetical protein
MLDPARPRKYLQEFFLRHGDERGFGPKDDRARRSRALVDDENMPIHGGYPCPNGKGSGAEPDPVLMRIQTADGDRFVAVPFPKA